jgi:tetratricopeptide (TPR) repeat protein
MKYWALVLLLIVTTGAVKAQGSASDTAFRFTHLVSRSVNQWVAFPKQTGTDLYPFGFVYIDPSQGFVFNLEGFMTVAGNGTFARVKQKIDEPTRQLYMLKPGTKTLVAHIDPEHNVELDIYPRPDWLESYNAYTDTAAHCVEWAKAYNGIKDSEMAVAILLPPYQTAPHTPGLEAELAHAYNELKRYDDAIKIAETALLNNVGEATLYRELGNGQLGKGKLDDALSTYTSGIKLCDPTEADVKSEMAMYAAIAYRNKGNKQAYGEWIQYAKLWAPKHSDIATVLEGM